MELNLVFLNFFNEYVKIKIKKRNIFTATNSGFYSFYRNKFLI